MTALKKISNLFFFWRWPKKFIAIFLIIVIGAGWYFYSASKNSKKEAVLFTNVKRQDIKAVVSASGTLNGSDSSDLKFKSSGKLAYLNVKEGDRVKKGQLIAGLDTKDLEIALQQARNSWLALDATAKRAEDDVKDHSTDETFTQRENRIKAQAARDSAFDSIKEAQKAIADAVIYSPIAGLITKADPNPGQFISVTDTIAQVVDDSQIYFYAEVDESDLGKIKIGQTADVTLNSYPDKVFKGIVEKITPTTKTTASGSTVVVTKINIGTPEVNFVTGLNGQATIVYEQSDNVLTIPADALKDDNTVFIKQGENYKSVKVSTGIKSDSSVEIKEGLEDNQEIVSNPQAVKDQSPSTNPIIRFFDRFVKRG